MNALETVKTLTAAIQSGDFKTAGTYLSDDFVFSGPVPAPINSQQWLDMSEVLRKAFPDLNYRFTTDGSQGDVYNISTQLSGTHKGSLDLTTQGMGIIPATGRTFSLAVQPGKVTVKNGKITTFALQPIEGAGLMALLTQIGVKVPSV